MKRFEYIVGVALIVMLIYSSMEVMFGAFGQIDHSITYIVPFRVNSAIILILFFVSVLANGLFPLWNVKKHYSFLTKKQITKYKDKYKLNYFKICMGYFVLLVWSTSLTVFDFMFWFGIISTLLFATWLLLWPTKKKIKKPKESKEEYSGLKIKRNKMESVTPRKNLSIYEYFNEN